MKIPRLFIRFLMFLYTAVIYTIAILPSESPPEILSFDKINHLGAFAVWILIWKTSFKNSGLFQSAGAAILFGIIIEITQSLTSYRFFDLMDLLADVAGIVAGLLIWKAVILLKLDQYFIRD